MLDVLSRIFSLSNCAGRHAQVAEVARTYTVLNHQLLTGRATPCTKSTCEVIVIHLQPEWVHRLAAVLAMIGAWRTVLLQWGRRVTAEFCVTLASMVADLHRCARIFFIDVIPTRAAVHLSPFVNTTGTTMNFAALVHICKCSSVKEKWQ